MSKRLIDWEHELEILIQEYLSPSPFDDDHGLDNSDLFEEGYTPEEALRVIIECNQINNYTYPGYNFLDV